MREASPRSLVFRANDGLSLPRPKRRAARDHNIWADMRAVAEEEFIRTHIDTREFYHITGHRPSASYTLAKLLWIKNNEPDVYKNIYKVLNAKDYIAYKMTGRFLTDYSDATGTNAYDLNAFRWSDKDIRCRRRGRGAFPGGGAFYACGGRT